MTNPPAGAGVGDPSGDLAQTRLHLAYAEGSVMLLEGLMLLLIERRVLPMVALIEAVESVIATKRTQVKDADHPQIAAIAAGVLSKIANSLSASGQRGH